MLSDHRIPASPCTQCGRRHDGAMETSGDGKKPQPGDITICTHCANVMAFGADLILRELTPAEIKEVYHDPNVILALVAVRSAIRERGDA